MARQHLVETSGRHFPDRLGRHRRHPETSFPPLSLVQAAGVVGAAVLEGLAALTLFIAVMLIGLWAAALLAQVL